MKFQMVHEGNTYDIFLDTDHPRMGAVLRQYPESVLKDMLANSFYGLGLNPNTVDEINKGGTWCVVSLAQ